MVATDNHMEPGEYPVIITVVDKEEDGRVIVNNDTPAVDDELTFTLSDPDGVNPVNDADIDWTIQRRDPMEEWGSLTEADPTSLMKTYEVDEDDSGKEICATVTYVDRKGPGKTAESEPTDAVVDSRLVAPPRFRSGAVQTITEGEAGRDTGQEIMATDRDGEVLIFGIQQGPHSDLFELIPSPSIETRRILLRHDASKTLITPDTPPSSAPSKPWTLRP